MVSILGVKIDDVAKSSALERVSDFLSDGKQHSIFTPNPEMLVAAHRDPYLREILNQGSLNICDGRGLEMMIKIKKNLNKLKRITGIDFMLDICSLAEKENKSVYLLGSDDQGVIGSAAKKLCEQFPKLTIAGFNRGPHIYAGSNARPVTPFIVDEREHNSIINDIKTTSPNILFVGFGHSKQEKWIHENLSQLPSVKIAMGVGGAFDILGGKFPRAPQLMRKAGLEWLWRLILEPRRIKRIWTAVVVFPALVIMKKG